ncbi:MAG: hypothetical protein LBU25_02200, partial [Treponema sp.]|nr:hypothetical protein [Treponema sp.]
MKKKVFLVMMPVMALVFGFVFTACPTDDDKGGGVEAGKLEGSGWVRIDTYSNQWDFTWTRTFTSDKAG